jgi:hypothetical protein
VKKKEKSKIPYLKTQREEIQEKYLEELYNEKN